MEIKLVQKEISEAVVAFIQSKGLDLTGMDTSVDFQMTRGEEGLNATVTFVKGTTAQAAVKQVVEVKAVVVPDEPIPVVVEEPAPVEAETPVEETPVVEEVKPTRRSIFAAKTE